MSFYLKGERQMERQRERGFGKRTAESERPKTQVERRPASQESVCVWISLYLTLTEAPFMRQQQRGCEIWMWSAVSLLSLMAPSDLHTSQCHCLFVTAAIKQESNRLSVQNASPDSCSELMLMLKLQYKSVLCMDVCVCAKYCLKSLRKTKVFSCCYVPLASTEPSGSQCVLNN